MMEKSSRPTWLDALRKAVIQQKPASLPKDEQDPIFQSLHKIVIDYDEYVSQMVIGVLTQKEEASSYPHRSLVQTAIEEVETVANPRQRRKIEQYRSYINRLDHMQGLAHQVSSENK
jgi:hypothetical protein